ncbi:MAG: M1 family aminopeptidase [Saprospiraceae bacterium]
MSDGRLVLAMSMYPKEGNPLWEKYSTRVVAHTLRWYSHYTFDYPYPLAWSIHTDRIGMEYPMICFNGGRPEEDGTYSKRTKYGLIGVIIHEVGHNFFPMIVNSDERQWTWMDEGLNTFVQFLTEQQWEKDYPSRRGPADKIVDYMAGDKSQISPIMTNSESIFQFGSNAYSKPATALNILRETVMGRELFDFAFKTYANRWKFKHPSPADFFRTMEDASAIDLDWFWWGWFYTTDHVDITIDGVKEYQIDTKDPDKNYAYILEQRKTEPVNLTLQKNKETIKQYQQDIDPVTFDFYNSYDEDKPTEKDYKNYEKFKMNLDEEDKELIEAGTYYYEITFENKGGLVMPIIVQFNFDDNTTEEIKIPAEIWKMNQKKVKKVFPFEKKVTQVILDPHLETADTDRSNNYYPKQEQISKFDLFLRKERERQNPMQESNTNN